MMKIGVCSCEAMSNILLIILVQQFFFDHGVLGLVSRNGHDFCIMVY